MKSQFFPTPQDAEAAFYQAFERADLDAMMAVWAEDDNVVCIHPTGPRLTGRSAVEDSWRRIFQGGSRMQFHISHTHYTHDGTLAIHVVHESIILQEDHRRPVLVATNAYHRTANGWRMILHHASQTPEAPPATPRPSTPARLH